MTVYEINFDGLVGPTHHYAGLPYGNEASIAHAEQISHPKVAALQGLEKMALLHRLGIKQAYLLPQHRPYLALLYELGYGDNEQRALELVYKHHPKLFTAIFSASSMWTANAATVTPASDTADGRLHVTVANLAAYLHRAIESEETMTELKHALGLVAHVHAPLPFGAQFSDEGAANHMRLSPSHAEPGVHVFVYGKSVSEGVLLPSRYPARQALEASEAIVRHHHIKTPVVYLQQHPDMIDAGVFHNDVIAMSNENILIVHEKAFLEADALDKIISACDFDMHIITISEDELSISDLISTYFFNSQLLTVPTGGMHMILPTECEHHIAVQKIVQRLLDEDNPIQQVHYVDCRQSMHNGGGPACLRLRVPMDETAFHGMNQDYVLTNEKIAHLRTCIEQYYPDKLMIRDFLDPDIRAQCVKATMLLHM